MELEECKIAQTSNIGGNNTSEEVVVEIKLTKCAQRINIRGNRAADLKIYERVLVGV